MAAAAGGPPRGGGRLELYPTLRLQRLGSIAVLQPVWQGEVAGPSLTVDLETGTLALAEHPKVRCCVFASCDLSVSLLRCLLGCRPGALAGDGPVPAFRSFRSDTIPTPHARLPVPSSPPLLPAHPARSPHPYTPLPAPPRWTRASPMCSACWAWRAWRRGPPWWWSRQSSRWAGGQPRCCWVVGAHEPTWANCACKRAWLGMLGRLIRGHAAKAALRHPAPLQPLSQFSAAVHSLPPWLLLLPAVGGQPARAPTVPCCRHRGAG